jgi:cytochrome c peroxidase
MDRVSAPGYSVMDVPRIEARRRCEAWHAFRICGAAMRISTRFVFSLLATGFLFGCATNPPAPTAERADRLILRVPSLKNIGKTAPYFHDNSTSNLEAAIRPMGRHQLGIELSNNDVIAIAAWMRALGGDIDPVYIAVPELPSEG